MTGLALYNSATGTRTRVARVRAEYPNQLDYSGVVSCCASVLSGKLPTNEITRTAVATAKPSTHRRARHLPPRQTKDCQLEPERSGVSIPSGNQRPFHIGMRHRRHLHDRHRQRRVRNGIRTKQQTTLHPYELELGRSHTQSQEHRRCYVGRSSRCARDI